MCCQSSTLWLSIIVVLADWISCCAQAPSANEPEERFRIDGTVLLVDDKPVFVRAIQFNGEPFSFLQSLGFNTIQLTAPATLAQRKEAARLGLWLVCPLPPSASIRKIDSSYQSILAWSVGERLSDRDIQTVNRSLNEARDADEYDRPVFGHIQSHWNSLARPLDLAALGMATIGTDYPIGNYGRWINQLVDQVSMPIWVDIQTELPSGLTQQVIEFVGRDEPLPMEHQQLMFQLYEAICGGARGVRFRSKTRLDLTDVYSRMRAASMGWLLRHCEQIEPWVAAGLVNEIQVNGNVSVHAAKIPGSQLLFLQRKTGQENWTCGNTEPSSIQFSSPGNLGDRIYQVDELGANLISGNDGAGRMIVLKNCPYTQCLLLTQDPLAVQQARSFFDTDRMLIRDRFQISERALAYFRLVEQRIAASGQGYPMLGSARESATNGLATAARMIETGNSSEALRLLERADFELARARNAVLNRQTDQLNGKVSSPLIRHFGLLAEHLELASALQSSTWNPNSLTGGDFESLEQMTQAGWTNQREEATGISSKVLLQKDAALDGTYGLAMRLKANLELPLILPSTPLRIRSARVDVKEGQLIRVHGYVNVTLDSREGLGLKISDSIGGDDLALNFQTTHGWQEFTLYRVAERNGELTVAFSMLGAGSAKVDEVTVRTMDRPENRQQADLNVSEIK